MLLRRFFCIVRFFRDIVFSVGKCLISNTEYGVRGSHSAKSGVDKSYRISDSIRRCEPMHFGIACEPRKLFFCIYARVFSYAGYCCVSVHFSTETGSKLLIAHCIEAS